MTDILNIWEMSEAELEVERQRMAARELLHEIGRCLRQAQNELESAQRNMQVATTKMEEVWKFTPLGT